MTDPSERGSLEPNSKKARATKLLFAAGLVGGLVSGWLDVRSNNQLGPAVTPRSGFGTEVSLGAPPSFSGSHDLVVDQFIVDQNDQYLADQLSRGRVHLPTLNPRNRNVPKSELARSTVDAFVMGWAFFLGPQRVQDIGGMVQVFNPDDRIGRWLYAHWELLDSETRDWISMFPRIMDRIQNDWGTMSAMEKGFYSKFYNANFMWFQTQIQPAKLGRRMRPVRVPKSTA